MPSRVSNANELLIQKVQNVLLKNGYDVKYYQRDDYPRFGQVSRVCEEIKLSSGMIVFGMKQTQIRQGTYRPGLAEEKNLIDTWMPTPWNDIEVGMGAMAGLPILLIKEDGINEGIFDNCLSEHYIVSISTDVNLRKLEENHSFVEWLSKL